MICHIILVPHNINNSHMNTYKKPNKNITFCKLYVVAGHETDLSYLNTNVHIHCSITFGLIHILEVFLNSISF